MEFPETPHAKLLREALEAGKDPHKAWAAHRLGIPYEEVTPEQRNLAKADNYYLLYSTSFMATVKWPGDKVPIKPYRP
jgi:DNA polymerase I-like protein with 3'-5' exonuclease and polymerase domains